MPQASLGAEGEELLAAAGGTESLCAGLQARDSLYLGHVQDLPEWEVVLSWAAVFITSSQS